MLIITGTVKSSNLEVRKLQKVCWENIQDTWSQMHTPDIIRLKIIKDVYAGLIAADIIKGKEIPGSKGTQSREYINLLFKVEEEIESLPF